MFSNRVVLYDIKNSSDQYCIYEVNVNPSNMHDLNKCLNSCERRYFLLIRYNDYEAFYGRQILHNIVRTQFLLHAEFLYIFSNDFGLFLSLL